MRAGPLALLAVLPLAASCNRLFFLPSKEKLARLEVLEGRYEAVGFPSRDGTRLSGLYFRAASRPPKAVVVHFHGNAENMTSHFLFAYWLVGEGYDLLAFDYRGYGSSGGRPSVGGAVEDGAAALRYARSRGAGRPLVAFGQSLGGALAVAAAALEPEGLGALVLESPFASYRRIARDKLSGLILTWALQWPLSALFSDRHAALRRAPGLPRVPALIVHGDSDPVVPIRHSRPLYEALPGPKDFWEVPGGGHTEAFTRFGREYRPRLLAFLDAALAPGAPTPGGPPGPGAPRRRATP